MSENKEYVGRKQFERLQRIGELTVLSVGISQLFPSEYELNLANSTSLTKMPGASSDQGGQLLVQLLPEFISDTSPSGDACSGFVEIVGTKLKAFSRDPSVLSTLRSQRARIEAARTSRAGTFARSAHYMGSKQALAPFMGEIIRNRFPPGGTVLDLMCGSGSATGYFARDWNVLASDAQRFSRQLALVQGGGFDVGRARHVIGGILDRAHQHFEEVEGLLEEDVRFEEQVLSSEFTDELKKAYVEWVTRFPRVTNALSRTHWLVEQAETRQHASSVHPYILFSAYYANLFFGVRQAIEIDSLRFGIDQLQDSYEKDWALGALICAVSACADNHGGHFAQPRVKLDDADDIGRKLPKTLFRRSLSVFQEFTARLLSLAEESTECKFPVRSLEGPWQVALREAAKSFTREELLVYLDPPYTRDEYSRYYHILETLMLYNYPKVSGRALVPEKGTENRFSSEFSTRVSANAEKLVGDILKKCLDQGWPVLWSYADSGIADMRKIIQRIEDHTKAVEIFDTDYFHSKQGRKGRQDVREYFVFLAPQ